LNEFIEYKARNVKKQEANYRFNAKQLIDTQNTVIDVGA